MSDDRIADSLISTGESFFRDGDLKMKRVRLLSLTALAPLFVSSALAQVALVPGLAACKDRDNMRRLVELTDLGDLAAAQELFARGVKSDDCRMLAGDDVVIEMTPLFMRVVKAHIRGNPDIYWILQ
ncbi:hypothetical protein CQW49_04790 [Methylosinus trichosporium OB3b]|uniref:Uncharacterized protein n=2 Tax=Methylocystaceae TaxID=31993 RepID=A0A2D2CX30_METT3|nr:hypothetical protein CQW49_04790 [Methylosinus trichosporium OB3b]OBS52094.1 hypothetical protein A8B73_13040 [Methylosinus sp. 3S-1]